MRTLFVALRLSVSLLFAGLMAAQTPAATLVGRIVDASHAAVVDAAIRVRDVNTNEIRTARSSGEGEYPVSSLPPGSYEVTVEKAGFKLTRETNLELAVEQTARLDVVLQVGAGSEGGGGKVGGAVLKTQDSSGGDV